MFREAVTEVDGFPSPEQIAADYADASGRPIEDLPFWVAFAYWKIAIIVEGVYRRWLNDPENGSGAGTLGDAVPRLAECAWRAFEDWV